MEIEEIISDAFKYPIKNIKAMGIYLLLLIVMVIGFVIFAVGIALGSEMNSYVLSIIIGGFGLILSLLILFLVEGYVLDVVKTGIFRENKAPELDFARQVLNGLKLIVATIVYVGIPFIIMAILFSINKYLIIVGFIIYVLAVFAYVMAQCRLAKTDSLGYALNIGESFRDIKRVGIAKFIIVVIILAVITAAISIFCSIIQQQSQAIGALLNGIFTLFMAFVEARGYGLLYSDIA